jgi:hypothetical protein
MSLFPDGKTPLAPDDDAPLIVQWDRDWAESGVAHVLRALALNLDCGENGDKEAERLCVQTETGHPVQVYPDLSFFESGPYRAIVCEEDGKQLASLEVTDVYLGDVLVANLHHLRRIIDAIEEWDSKQQTPSWPKAK